MTYSYLLLPVGYLLLNNKNRFTLLLGIYGFAFFFLLFSYKYIPSHYRDVYVYSFTFLEYIFFALLYFISSDNKKFKSVIKIFTIVFFITQLSLFFSTKTHRIDSIPIAIETILIFCFMFYVLFEKTFSNEIMNKTSGMGGSVTNLPVFWASVGILIYLGGTFFLFIIANNLSSQEYARYWYYNYIADTIKTLFFCIALYLNSKPKVEKNQAKKSLPNLDFTL